MVRGAALGHGAAAAALAALLAERDLLRWAAPNDPRPLPPDLRLQARSPDQRPRPLPGLALHHATLQRVRDVARHLQAAWPAPTNQEPANQELTHAPLGLLSRPGLPRPRWPSAKRPTACASLRASA
ncbi:MAG: hypothetical protein WKG07_19105 [Hymenobacter sp.]